MSKEMNQFLALLRAGLWGTQVDPALFNESVDWDSIFAYSLEQTVLGIVADGVNTLPSAHQPPVELLNKMRARITTGIRTHAKHNRTLAEVVDVFRKNNIRTLLLKGQGVAMNYIDPTRRQCGDIDLYVGKADYERACTLAIDHFGEDKHAVNSEKHYHFVYDDVHIELHHISEQLSTPWHDHRFQRWSDNHLFGNQLRIVEIEGVVVLLPPVDFDVLYIFNHAWRHFITGGGVGLRQLCDWSRFLHTFHHEVNTMELERNLKAFGLWRAWQIFGHIAVDNLGLPQEKFPFYTTRFARQAERMLEMIGSEGNFGRFDSSRANRPKGYITGKIHTFKWMHRRFGRLLPLHASQVLASWAYYISIGLKQVVNDKLKR